MQISEDVYLSSPLFTWDFANFRQDRPLRQQCESWWRTWSPLSTVDDQMVYRLEFYAPDEEDDPPGRPYAVVYRYHLNEQGARHWEDNPDGTPGRERVAVLPPLKAFLDELPPDSLR
jgi:hypothetical protein